MTYFFRLQCTDGSPADPPTLRSSVFSWRQGDTIPIRPGRTLRVVVVAVDVGEDDDRVLIVEPVTSEPDAA
jgi:hypothetical protein